MTTGRERALFSSLPMLAAFLTILLAIAAFAPAIQSAHDVRSLPVQDAKNGKRVTLTGTVTFRPPRGNYFYLQDDTGGVRVEWLSDRALRLGERVKVSGVTIAGAFLPEVKANSVVSMDPDPTRKNRLPVPAAYTLTLDDAPYLDGQWVEVTAVVQRVWTTDGWLQFDLARGRGGAVAYVPLPLAVQVKKAEQFAGAVVKVRGVCRVNATANRQMAGPPRILVNNLNAFEEIKPPPTGLQSMPITTARDLAPFRPDPLAARLPVHVAGVITLNQGGRQFYIHDGTGVFQALTTGTVHAEPGDHVDVIGYPRLSTDPIRLDNAQIQVTGTAPLPLPRPATPAQARDGKFEGHVVKLTGVVHEARRQRNWMTLTLVADGLTFTVLFLERLPDETEVTPPATPGSKVEVVGVATRQTLEGIHRTAFAVMAQGDGLTVLESPSDPPLPPPSWWTGRRVAYLIAGFVGLFLLGGATVAVLRRQVRRATALVRKQYEEKEKLEGQLKLAAKLEAVGRLAGGIAHDFNNLLTVINGCAQLLEEEITKDPMHALALAGEIQRAGVQAAALTRQLLTFSRQRTVTPHPLDLNATISEAGRVLVRLVGERVTLRVVTEPNLPPVMAEASLLSQILLNLAVNARDAMPDGGTLTLSTSLAEPGWVRLTTADTGVGMTDEVKSRVFEPFFTTKDVGKGTGLGLSTVYGIVQTLGGKIRFHSELGRGTAFEVDLPAVGVDLTRLTPPGPLTPLHLPLPPESAEMPTAIAGHDETLVASATRQPVAISSQQPESPVVFLVEDDDAVRVLVRHILEQAGFTVFSTTEPEEALIILADYAGTVDLLITDVMMPKLSGRQLADLVHASRPDTRVLFISGYTSDEVLRQGVREDQVEFLHKPFAPHELIERIRRILG